MSSDRSESALRAIERALDALFRRVNVNRPRDPELDAVLEALAAIRAGVARALGEPLPSRPEAPDGLSMSAESGKDAVRLYARDAGAKRRRLAAALPTKLPEQ